jgi:hypothetical protein
MELILESGWNGGIVEYWVSKTDGGQILTSDPCHPYKNKPNSAKPIIPTLQSSGGSTIFDYFAGQGHGAADFL